MGEITLLVQQEDQVTACLAEKCPKEKGEKSGHVGFCFQVVSQVFKSKLILSIYNLPLCRGWTHTLHNCLQVVLGGVVLPQKTIWHAFKGGYATQRWCTPDGISG